MKSLYIIRHAKSSWGDFSLPDIERPLNDRGKNDAPMMAKRLLDKNISIDVFISSPAKRALKTCKLFCSEYKRDEKSIVIEERLYHASVETFFRVVSHIDDQFKSAAIFSHNPGITDFVNSLGLDVKIDNMPTCAVFGVKLLSDKWEDFNKAEKVFEFFQYPKLT
jgi:phosphohistidine phosphatase